MNWLRVGKTRIEALCRKRRVEAEIEAELRFHLAMRIRANVAAGMETAEAAQDAQVQFGNFNSIKEACRDVRGGGLLETLWQDLRFGARVLLRDRGFAAIAVLVLALTIGANTAIFNLVSRVLLRPLPFSEPARILSIWNLVATRPDGCVGVSYSDVQEFRAQNRWFDSLGVFVPADFVLKSEGGEATRVQGARVSASIFPLPGIPAVIGRTFVAADDEPGGRSAIVSSEFWRQKFDGAPGVIGAPITIDGKEHRIVGVMPDGFAFPILNQAVKVWTTVATEREPALDGGVSRAGRRGNQNWRMIGRLKEGASEEEARA